MFRTKKFSLPFGSSAFYNCSLLTSITIPNSVTYFGYGTVSAYDSPFVTIYCNAGSKAEELATQYGIPYSTEPYEPKFNIFENGDNATAVVALKKWMGGVYGETEIEKSADLTRDGEVNVGDVIWLKRHIAGWVGYQFPTYSGGK